MKGLYLVMDNALNHTINEISDMVIERGCKYVYFPPYSSELNPIKDF